MNKSWPSQCATLRVWKRHYQWYQVAVSGLLSRKEMRGALGGRLSSSHVPSESLPSLGWTWRLSQLAPCCDKMLCSSLSNAWVDRWMDRGEQKNKTKKNKKSQCLQPEPETFHIWLQRHGELWGEMCWCEASHPSFRAWGCSGHDSPCPRWIQQPPKPKCH